MLLHSIALATALLAPPAATPIPATRPLDDATIVAIFDAANTADIETGKLAAERGASKEVRAFGAMLAHDHEQVRQMGATWPGSSASPQHRLPTTRVRAHTRRR